MCIHLPPVVVGIYKTLYDWKHHIWHLQHRHCCCHIEDNIHWRNSHTFPSLSNLHPVGNQLKCSARWGCLEDQEGRNNVQCGKKHHILLSLRMRLANMGQYIHVKHMPCSTGSLHCAHTHLEGWLYMLIKRTF